MHTFTMNTPARAAAAWVALGVAVAVLTGCAPSVPYWMPGETGSPVLKEYTVMPTGELHHYGKDEGEAAAMEAEAAPTEAGVPMTWDEVGASEYLIGAGDVLEFRSYDDETLNRQVVVRYDGFVSLPLIPDINVEDTTREKAFEMIRAAYAEVFRDPQLSITIVQSQSKSFFVMGEVSRPNEYVYRRPVTLLDAINVAGGPRINQRSGDTFVGAQGQLAKAIIIRHVEGERKVFEFDLKNLSSSGAHDSDTPVFPGDIVYVPEGVNLVYVIGEINRPGVLQMTEGMTLMELLARVGGFRESTARMHHLVLMRELDKEQTKIMLINIRTMLHTGHDVPIQPGDVIYLPRKPLVNIRDFVTRFTGTISPVLSLYTQAYDAYYTDEQWDRILDRGDSTGEVLAAIQGITNVANALPPVVEPVVP